MARMTAEAHRPLWDAFAAALAKGVSGPVAAGLTGLLAGGRP